ncbi:MAG TPA: hypothetical protein VM123_19930 [archaeon]|nr:hypothetical protein [archaeon]
MDENKKYMLPVKGDKKGFSIIENDLLRSPALLSLGASSLKLYLLLRSHAMVTHPVGGKPGRGGRSWIENKLILTYKKAGEYFNQGKKQKVSSATISRAFRELIEKGLLDVDKWGHGKCKVASVYSLSTRWRLYGQPSFQQVDIDKWHNISLAGQRALIAFNSSEKTPATFLDTVEAGKDKRTKKDTT